MEIRKLPIGIQDFETIRTDGYIYVDKTAYIYRLVTLGKPYFLSRPRRFGKSLLITTLEAYFLGKKELFHGLEIEKYETEWTAYPVLKFSLAGGEFTKEDGLASALRNWLLNFEQKYGLPSDEPTLPVRFQNALKNAYEKTGLRVVVLVDEYDNPLLKAFATDSKQEQRNRELYKGFFAILKDCDTYLRFVLFTGVTKFSKVSIFSDLNQFQDISMHPQYAEICGITQAELEANFSPEIDAMAEAHKMTREDCLAKLKQLYDGYRFCDGSKNIYNPFSIISAFSSLKFGKYWFSTGTPTFLVKRLNETGFDPKRFSDGSLYTTEDAISDYRPDNPDIVPLLYQSGYLTLKGYDERRQRFTLGYPNDEVKYGFTASLAPVYLNNTKHSTGTDIFAIDDALEAGDTDTLRDQFTALFAHLPYTSGVPDAKKDAIIEQNFQNVVYLVFLQLGQFVHVEQHSAKGRADCITETDEYVYIFEFKRDISADNALAQIDAQGYAKPYEADTRKLIKIGVCFSSEEKNITEWKIGTVATLTQ